MPGTHGLVARLRKLTKTKDMDDLVRVTFAIASENAVVASLIAHTGALMKWALMSVYESALTAQMQRILEGSVKGPARRNEL